MTPEELQVPVTEIEAAELLSVLDGVLADKLRRLLFQRNTPLLCSVVRTLAASFPDDPSAPNVSLALLPDGRWYGSLIRFSEAYGQGKQVLVNASGVDLDEVLRKLADKLGI